MPNVLTDDIMIHPLGFAPDLPTNTLKPGIIITDMNGMYPTLSGVRMLPSLVQNSQSLADPVIEAFVGVTTAGEFNTFAFTGQHIYVLNPATLALTEVDGGQTFSASQWSFDQFGDDTIAVDGNDLVQVFNPSTGVFSSLAGNPPVAKYVAVVDPGVGAGAVVILANLSTDATGIVTSGPGSDTIWTLNVNDSSTSDFLRSQPGPITALKSIRTYAAAFKANSLYLGTWIGPPFIWGWQLISDQVGTQSNDGVVDIGDYLFFVGPDDFYQFDGSNVTPIANGLKEWFFGTPGLPTTGYANQNYLNKIQGRYDTTTSCVYWHFSSVNASPSGTLDTYVVYNRRAGRWGVGHLNVNAVLQPRYTAAGMTYAQFTLLYQTYGNLPHLTYGDSSFQPSAQSVQGLFLTANNALFVYSGTPNSGYVQFGDIGVSGKLTQINGLFGLYGVYPTAGATLATTSRVNLGDGATTRFTNIPLGTRSDYTFRQTGYWAELRFNYTTDAELYGFHLDARFAGDR